MPEYFKLNNIILSNLYKDITTKNIIRKINYKNDTNKLMVETPLLIIDNIYLQKYDMYKKICIKCHLANNNTDFTETLQEIDEFCINKLSKGKELYKTVYENKQFTFYIPIYNDNINVLIEDKNKNIVSIKNLNKGLGIKIILLLSHMEVGNNNVFCCYIFIKIG